MSVGRIILTSLEFVKPELSKPLQKAELNVGEEGKSEPLADPGKPKPAPLKGKVY